MAGSTNSALQPAIAGVMGLGDRRSLHDKLLNYAPLLGAGNSCRYRHRYCRKRRRGPSPRSGDRTSRIQDGIPFPCRSGGLVGLPARQNCRPTPFPPGPLFLFCSVGTSRAVYGQHHRSFWVPDPGHELPPWSFPVLSLHVALAHWLLSSAIPEYQQSYVDNTTV